MGTVVWIALTVVVVAIIVALIMPGRKDKARTDDGMSTAEVTDWLRGAWARAEEAIAAHHKARGAEVGPAQERMLRLADEIDAELREIERTSSESERQMLMLKLAAEEIRASINDGIAKHPEPATYGQMSTERMSEIQRGLWERAERAVRAYVDARGDDVEPARQRMLQVAGEVDATVERFGAQGVSARQLAMWRLAAEEIREFVNDALAGHPEGQRD